MEEIKKIILEGDEVDEYNKLQNNFQESVEEGVQQELNIKSNWRYLRYILIIWLIMVLTLNLFGIKIIT